MLARRDLAVPLTSRVVEDADPYTVGADACIRPRRFAVPLTSRVVEDADPHILSLAKHFITRRKLWPKF